MSFESFDLDRSLRTSIETEALEDNDRRRKMDRLKGHAKLYGYTVSSNVPYDGDCFFSSICHHLERADTVTAGSAAASLRRELVSFLASKKCGPLRSAQGCRIGYHRLTQRVVRSD